MNQDRLSPGALDGTRVLVLMPLLALLAAAMALAMYKFPPPPPGLVIAGSLAATAVLALAVVRYSAAVALGMLLLGVVIVDPAPPDLVFAIAIGVALVTGRFDADRVPTLISGLLAALLGLNVISTLQAPETTRATFFFAITIYLAVFSIWLAGYVRSVERARTVFIAYLAGALITAVAASAAMLASFPGSDIFLVPDATRAKGLFQEPNVYAPFLIVPAVILLQETVEPRLLRVGAPLKIAMTLLLFIGVLFSFSRGAWLNAVIGIAVTMIVIIARRGGLRKLPTMLTVLVLAGVSMFAVIGLSGETQFLEERTGTQSYDSDRFAAQDTGVELAAQHPFGIGPGQFEVASPVSSHSLYIRVLAEQGALGLAILAALILVTLMLAIRNALQGRHTFGIGSAALLGAFCGLLVNSFFVDTLHWRHLWVLLALIWAGSMRPREADAQPASTAALRPAASPK